MNTPMANSYVCLFCVFIFIVTVLIHSQTASSERQSKLESEQRSMAETVKTLQKNIVQERRIFDLCLNFYQWRTLHEILGGGECQGPCKIYMSVPW